MSFEELNALEVAVMTFGAYMILLNTYFWLRSMDLQVLLRTAQSCMQYLRDVGGARRRETMDVLVSSRLQLRRESDLHGLCALGTLVCSVGCVPIIREKLTGTGAQPSMTQEVASITQEVAFLLLFFFVTLFRARKHLLKGVGVYFFYCALMACLSVVGGSVPNNGFSITFVWLRITVIRVVLSMCCLNPGLVLLINLLFSASIVCASILRPLDADNLALLFGEESKFFLAMVLCSFSYHHHVVTGLRQELNADAQKIEKSAVTDLLDAVCDVNLTLDESFRIADHSERFAALMMLPVSRSLRGVDIQDFVPKEQDKSRIRTQLSKLRTGDNHCACALNFSMRDSNRSDLRVEMLSVPFVALNGSNHFMVGIREIAGTTRLATLPASFDEMPELPELVSATRSESTTPSRIAERSVPALYEQSPSRQVSPSWHGTPPNLQDGILGSEHSIGSSSRLSLGSSPVESDLRLHVSSRGQHSSVDSSESLHLETSRDGAHLRIAL
eukprot:TRINITY_DN6018_c0_g1_i2.p1 TRINITY_DN6018_c0_g1~~TRINITY_DN6018_c0_g1_i2.p1  ORF type:complete len:522 (-),score=41.05 TRINITY_DN6018_c0_g1_i2:273-1775(-)